MWRYFTWKVKKIKEVIKNTIKNKRLNEGSKENVKFNIFDDMNDYFLKIRKLEDKWHIQINLTLIENENSWNQLLQ